VLIKKKKKMLTKHGYLPTSATIAETNRKKYIFDPPNTTYCHNITRVKFYFRRIFW